MNSMNSMVLTRGGSNLLRARDHRKSCRIKATHMATVAGMKTSSGVNFSKWAAFTCVNSRSMMLITIPSSKEITGRQILRNVTLSRTPCGRLTCTSTSSWTGLRATTIRRIFLVGETCGREKAFSKATFSRMTVMAAHFSNATSHRVTS